MTGTLDDAPRPRHRTVVAGAVAVLLLVVAAVVVWALAGRDGDRPTPQPAGPPGTLVDSEPLTTGVPEGLQGWRITYVTSDVHGERVTASGTVLAAPSESDRPRPALALAHGTTGIDQECAPSSASTPDLGPPAAGYLLRDGWVTVSADYVGLGEPGRHGYLVGREEGQAVLDSVRAAGELLPLEPRTVVWGHSQGGHAALWAAALGASYAPELQLLGAAATAPATDLRGLVRETGSTLAGKVVAAFLAASWRDVYGEPEGEAWVSPANLEVVSEIGEHCVPEEQASVYGLAARMDGPVLQEDALRGQLGRLMAANTPRGPFRVPVLVAQGTGDVAVPAALQRRWVRTQCARGASLDYREYPGLGHTDLVAASSPLSRDLIAWTRDRVAGEPVRDSCGPARRFPQR